MTEEPTNEAVAGDYVAHTDTLLTRGHPTNPRSNIAKFGAYDPEKYAICTVSPTVATDEALLPNRPPCLTQRCIGMFLRPLTRELDQVPPFPTIDELPDSVINRMVYRDKAFWVDKPGANAYCLHQAYYDYDMSTSIIKPTPQAVFPRSYQYDLDCVMHRRATACMKHAACNKTPTSAQCQDCNDRKRPAQSRFQETWAEDAGQKRWRNYPDLTTPLGLDEIRTLMTVEVGRPFQSEACNWYNMNYPSEKYDVILRKFSK